MTMSAADRRITSAQGRTSKNGQCLRCPYEALDALACMRAQAWQALPRVTLGDAVSTAAVRARLVRAPVERMRCLAMRSSMAGTANPLPPHSPLVHTSEGRFYMPRMPPALHAVSGASLTAWLYVPACYVLITGGPREAK
ncbi:hypothetical protein FB451DRAFT_1563224 [Mycena latifolia]|nr:hypothetical protein FB451DRAFT_1563224 [Mycena latifolia]